MDARLEALQEEAEAEREGLAQRLADATADMRRMAAVERTLTARVVGVFMMGRLAGGDAIF